jgi:hypothetical protein
MEKVQIGSFRYTARISQISLRGILMVFKKLSFVLCLLIIHSIVWADNSSVNIDMHDDALYTRIALDVFGNPSVVYWAPMREAMQLVHCFDPHCEGDMEMTTLAEGNGFLSITLLIDDSDRHYVNYYDIEHEEIRIAICETFACDALTIVRLGRSTNGRTSMTLDERGYPVVIYYTGEEYYLVHCEDEACEDKTTTHLDDLYTPGNFDLVPLDLALDEHGNPLVALTEGSDSDLVLLFCYSRNCDDGIAFENVDSRINADSPISMAVNSEGDATIAYYTEYGLMLATCREFLCEDVLRIADVPMAIDVSLAIDDTNSAILAYLEDASGALHLVTCDDVDCLDRSDHLLDYSGRFVDLVLDAESNPLITIDSTDSTRGVLVIHCDSRNCE